MNKQSTGISAATPVRVPDTTTNAKPHEEKPKAHVSPFWEDFYGKPYFPNPDTWQTQVPKEWLTPPTKQECEEAWVSYMAGRTKPPHHDAHQEKTYDPEEDW